MIEPAISVRNLSKCYRLGVIGRQTLVDEFHYWWHKIRGRDPKSHMGKIGHSATESRRVDAEIQGENRFWALKGVTFDVNAGEVIGIIGGNGAGKSTLLKILTRVTEPTEGEAFINGRVASLLEVGTGFHPDLTGRENVYMNGTILGMKKTEINAKFDQIVEFSGLRQFIDTPVKRYSSGMYVRLAFAVAAHLDPEILLIDEVLAVGDAEFQKKCLGKMGDIARDGRTVLFVSHNMNAIKRLCHRAVLLEDGGIKLLGPVDKCVAQYLNRNLVEGAEAGPAVINRKMDGIILKDTPHIRLLSVRLEDASGHLQKDFRSDQDIIVCLRFECLMSVPSVYAMVNICDENANPILISQNTDDAKFAKYSRNMKPGHYEARCVLPKNTFGHRSFYVSIHLIAEKTEHLIFEKLLSFNVTFQSYDGSFSEPDVFFRPCLEWSVKNINGDE